jgi:antitoxin (DNA-binding transcriptional repressor) of toxin-antitoxin stability system
MDVPICELGKQAARVIAAVEAGESVVLTMDGRHVANIVPRRARHEHRASESLLSDLAAISQLARELGVSSDAADFEIGLSTDDIVA